MSKALSTPNPGQAWTLARPGAQRKPRRSTTTTSRGHVRLHRWGPLEAAVVDCWSLFGRGWRRSIGSVLSYMLVHVYSASHVQQLV